jgi:hypothetical protein
MTKFVLALAAAGTLLASGVAMAQVDVRIGERPGWDRGRDFEHRGEIREGVRGEFRGCKTVTVRERRGDAVVVKRIKRC